jgi:hypothetical protein
MIRRVWILSVTALLAISVARAETTYWRVTMDRMTVITDGNSERCSRFASQLVVFERLLRQLAGWSSDYQPPPIALYSLSQADADRVFLSDADRREQISSNMRVYSKYLPSRESNLAVTVNESGSDDPLQSVLLLYAESELQRGPTGRYPPWFQFGVANIINGLLIRQDGSVLLNRNVPFEPIEPKNGVAHERYDLLKLLQAGPRDLTAASDYKEFMRVARDWAQFGLLTTQQRRVAYRDLAIAMRQGAPATEAVKDAFGVPLEEIAAEFHSAVWRKDVQFRVTPPGEPLVIPAPVKLDADQAKAVLQLVATRATRAPGQSM